MDAYRGSTLVGQRDGNARRAVGDVHDAVAKPGHARSLSDVLGALSCVANNTRVPSAGSSEGRFLREKPLCWANIPDGHFFVENRRFMPVLAVSFFK